MHRAANKKNSDSIRFLEYFFYSLKKLSEFVGWRFCFIARFAWLFLRKLSFAFLRKKINFMHDIQMYNVKIIVIVTVQKVTVFYMSINNKYETIVVYICRAATKAGKPFNKTKLVKTVWLADILNYAQYGDTITRDQIKKMQFGPVNAGVFKVIESAVTNKKINCHSSGVRNSEYLYTADKDPKLDGVLYPHEVAFINDALNNNMHKTAGEISEITHEFDAWKKHAIGDIIEPVEFLINSAELDESDDVFEKENHRLFA